MTTTTKSHIKYIQYKGHEIEIRHTSYGGDIAIGAYYRGNWMAGGATVEEAESAIKKDIDTAINWGGFLYGGGR